MSQVSYEVVWLLLQVDTTIDFPARLGQVCWCRYKRTNIEVDRHFL